MTFEALSFLERGARRHRDSALCERADRNLPANVEKVAEAKETAFALKVQEPTPANWPRVFPGL